MVAFPRSGKVKKLNKNVPRVKGRFARYKEVADDSEPYAPTKSAYNAEKERVKRVYFDKYVELVVLKGDDSDWLPTSQSTGPLVNLAECLFKKSFCLTRSERSDKVHLHFAGGNPKNVQPITERVTTRDANLSEGPTSRVFKYSGLRLPKIANHTSEIEPVLAFLQELVEGEALRFKTVEEAFTVCLDTFKSYVFVNGSPHYKGYPNCLRRRPVPSSIAEESNARQGNSQTDGGSGSTTRDTTLAPACSTSLDVGADPEGEEENAESDTEAGGSELYKMAMDDGTYQLLSVIFDERVMHKFDLVSGLFLRKSRTRKGLLIPLLKEALLYLHWETHGIRDPIIHLKREQKLRAITESLTLMREAYGEKTFEDMRYAFEEN